MSQHHSAALAPLGWSPSRQAELDALGRPAAIPARVARVDRGACVAVTAGGSVRVEAPGLAAGDWIVLEDGRPAAVLTRRTLLQRRAAGRPDAGQAIAANVDVVGVVHGLDRPLRDRRLHRALALAWESGATPVVVLTKADLDGDAAARALDAEVAFGVDALTVSARTGAGLDALAARARPDRTLVLVGESGAGKSTLVNALVGREALATGPVRDGDQKGRHTTTARHLVPLPGGGALIDTPGVRELGLWGSDGGVRAAFADIAALADGCRFADCRHDGEPGCAVAAAVADGSLDPRRLESHRDLARELSSLARREDERAWRAHGRQGSRMAREASRHKRRGRA
ncbi:MAG: ribosome small subunit-dependent GTPase A [Thermoleophilia bacterium]